MATIETYARPTWLYRHRSLRPRGADGDGAADRERLERELSAIEQGYIWCGKFNEMNDPMEGFYRSNGSAMENPGYEEFVETVRQEKLGLGIASLSETWDNELMWAHYADGFRGICVAYPMARLLECLDGTHALARVAYGDRPHYLNLSAMRDADHRARAILSTKNVKWSYEREWRLFAAHRGEARYVGRGAVTVYLGMRMAAEDRRLVTRRMKAAGITVRRTSVDGYSVRCSDPS
ncbi:DUF2971 domain-containing protein [Sphingomonas morindae]|uniref:DUF2971 domain-containing protein n=1 Tax=Sphingomonas morindae TaxID=1541170 RepID=A0ABY4X9D7_9SPHN|nr:DUF2971 domain-containing protein [Sphingomonas morindae]USI73572.1 DUF2971 domain-containing protein [Sphingomonas morindae]